MLRTDFHFELPKELIAQRPAEVRSGSRLLTLDGLTGAFADRQGRKVEAAHWADASWASARTFWPA